MSQRHVFVVHGSSFWRKNVNLINFLGSLNSFILIIQSFYLLIYDRKYSDIVVLTQSNQLQVIAQLASTTNTTYSIYLMKITNNRLQMYGLKFSSLTYITRHGPTS